jgi:lactate permease
MRIMALATIIASVPLLGTLLILLPIIVALYLLAIRRWSADKVGVVAFGLGVFISILFFGTNPLLAVVSSIAGIIASFPISLMVVTSILMITHMVRTGALARITVFFKTLGSGRKAIQIMLINVGLGLFLVGLGATPVSMLPPVMLAMGFSPLVAVMLPSIGYDPLTTYALLGIPVLVFSDVVPSTYWTTRYPGVEPLYMSGHIFSLYMPIVATGIALAMLWLAGGRKLLFSREAILLAFVTGIVAGLVCYFCNLIWVGFTTLTNIFAGLAVIAAMLSYSKLRGLPLVDKSILTEEDRPVIQSMGLLHAMTPWLILIIFCFIVNLVPPIYNLLFNVLTFPITIGIITINTRFLWNAYFWVLIATSLAILIDSLIARSQKEIPRFRQEVRDTMSTWARRVWRPFVSATIFFALAYIMIYSGNVIAPDGSWIRIDEWNMIFVLSAVTATTFGPFYPLTAAFLGLLGGFVSGSETSTIVMFQPYHQLTSSTINAQPLIVGASSGIGGGLASVLSPAKLQNAAAVIDAKDIEGQVLRKALPIILIVTTAVAILAFFWGYYIP